MNILGSWITYPNRGPAWPLTSSTAFTCIAIPDESIMPVHYPLAIIPYPDLQTGDVSVSAAGVQTF
jgi:hypothetical protein